jgi:hypothetical protein
MPDLLALPPFTFLSLPAGILRFFCLNSRRIQNIVRVSLYSSQVLCKNLGVEISDLRPGNALKGERN